MAKYDGLAKWLKQAKPPNLSLTFEEIEKIIGSDLPASAIRHRSWWGNETNAKSRQCDAWLAAGWNVDSADLKNRCIGFKRVDPGKGNPSGA